MTDSPHFVKNQFMDVVAVRPAFLGDEGWGESCWEAVCQIVLGAHTGWEQFSLPPACVKRLCNTWNIRESLQKFLTLAEVLN